MCSALRSAPLPIPFGCVPRRGSLGRFAQPTVSAIIPVYNGEHSIRDAVASVIAQTFSHLELIVVDDGSGDGTLDALAELRDPRLLIVRHVANKGAAAARNSGVRSARGHYVAFLDADDRWAPEKLERQLAYMAAQEGKIRLSCTAFHYQDRESGLQETRVLPPIVSQEALLYGCRCSPGSTLMAERSLFKEAGLWNEQIRRLEDWDWLLRCSLLSPLGILQQPLTTVQARLSSDSHYVYVAQSIEHLRRSLDGVAKGVGGFKSRYTASAGLANELAAAAYRDGKLLIAARHFVKAIALAPAHQFSVAVRAVRRMWHDITCAFGTILSQASEIFSAKSLRRGKWEHL